MKQERDLESTKSDTHSSNRTKTQSSSRDSGMTKHSAVEKVERYARKTRTDKDGNDRSSKKGISRDRELYDGTSGREGRFRKGDREEIKDVARISYHKGDKKDKRERNSDENDRSRKRRRSRDRELNDNTSGTEKRLRNEADDEIKEVSRIYRKYDRDGQASNPEYGRERSSNYVRYWGNGNFESHDESQSSDQYWSQYTSDGTRKVRQHCHGKSSHDSQSQSKADEDKESQRQRDVRSRRDVVSADISEETEKNNPSTEQSDVPTAQKKAVDLLTTRTGGAYIPPAKLRMMQAQITDKSSAAYQRIAWEALKKSIHGHINKVNTGNITIIVRELVKENIVRGRGLLCRSIIQAQAASPTFTHVYSALVAVINSKVRSVR